MFRELGDVEGIAWSLISLAAVARYQGHREQAAALLAESRSSSERIGFNEGVAWSLEQLGLLATEDGDPTAGPLLVRSLAVHRELHDRWRMSSVLEDLAALSLARGNPARAARLLAAAGAIREAIGTVIPPCEAEQHTRTLAAAQAALGADAFAAAWQEGLLASADALLAELQAEWPAGDVTAGGAAGSRARPGRPERQGTLPRPGTRSPGTGGRGAGRPGRHGPGTGGTPGRRQPGRAVRPRRRPGRPGTRQRGHCQRHPRRNHPGQQHTGQQHTGPQRISRDHGGPRRRPRRCASGPSARLPCTARMSR